MRKVREKRSKQLALRIPAEADWGYYRDDLDVQWAHDQFCGRTNEEMQPYIQGAPLGAVEDLRFMPEVPFRYYVLGYRDYIMSGKFGPYDAASAASCFIRLVLDKLKHQPRYIVPVMPDLLPTLAHISQHQAAFEADESIYGSFPTLFQEIQKLYEEVRDRYRRL